MSRDVELCLSGQPDVLPKEPVTGKPDMPPKRPAGPEWPAPLEKAALHGLAGDYLACVEPTSEADPAALLLQFLIAFGNVVGHGPHFITEDTRQYLNLYGVLVGRTAKARKGTSWNRVRKLFEQVDELWLTKCVGSGLSSGEGLIEAVRDPSEDEEADDEKEEETPDKRLLIVQGEFCGVLKQMEREGNVLSIVLRDAWDGNILRTMARKSNALRSTDAHLSIIGHITGDELRSNLTETDKVNGFCNRILWFAAKRSRCLPDEVPLDSVSWANILGRVKMAVTTGRVVAKMKRDGAAQEIWRAVYPKLSEERLGLLGAVTSRCEAQVVRLSCIYALLNCSHMVSADHLLAALAVWRYADDSARFIFGDATGDPVADAIVGALKISSRLTRTQINDLFKRHKGAARIEMALNLLRERGVIALRVERTSGRSVEVWELVGRGSNTRTT
jgi:hypothetical protein